MDSTQIHQPHTDWPWTLSESGNIFSDFTWEDIEYDLAQLYSDHDNFLILEQKDPADASRYWFIQSAIVLAGPDKGNYIVGVGWDGESGPALVERCYHWKDLDTVIDIFQRAFQRQELDLTGYESFF